jgi:SpoIID/LytB domain protein
MRRLFLPVAVLAALAFASSGASGTLFVVDGRGWGHGVGMSQWGAQGRAQRGVGHADILGFYYPGTTLGQTSVRRVRVLLASGRSSLRIWSDKPFKIGSRTLAANTVYTLVPSGDGHVRVVGMRKFGNPATVSPTTGFLRLGNAPYRGSFRIWVRAGRLAAVNVVGLEGYLLSVVPREMPTSFRSEALATQAVAARSYALRSHLASWFDLYDDTRSQVYGGVDGEDHGGPATAAVNSSAREVVLYNGQVAQTFFSSSNGGYVAASSDVWNGPPVAYLQARRDPDDLTPGNPNRYWKHVLTAGRMARRLGIGRPHDVSTARNGSGRAAAVAFATRAGTVSFAGTSIQDRFGLKSTRFWIGVQSFSANRTRSSCKRSVRFSVFAHGVGALQLQRRSVKETSWTTIPLTFVDATHWTALHRPCVSTDYRLVSKKARGRATRLPVSPAVGIETVRAGSVGGHVNPLLPGVAVAIQRRTSQGWQTVKRTTIRSDGSFRAAFPVVEGRYRARVAPPSSTGLVTGYSAPVTVVTH